jgi:hypothetical protein
LPPTADLKKIVIENNAGSCSGNSSTDWNLTAGLPFSMSSGALSADLAATLQRARTVTVSVTSYSVDVLNESQWKAAFAPLPPSNIYKAALVQPGGLLAENVVRVTGLKAVFSFDNKLSAEVQAKFKGKTFSVGDPANNSGAQGASAGAAASKPDRLGGVQAATAGSNSAGAADPCALPSSPPAAPGSPAPASAGAATLRGDVISDSQIAVCGSGPFYMLAAYSKLVNGDVVGLAPDPSSMRLEPVQLPGGVKIR